MSYFKPRIMTICTAEGECAFSFFGTKGSAADLFPSGLCPVCGAPLEEFDAVDSAACNFGLAMLAAGFPIEFALAMAERMRDTMIREARALDLIGREIAGCGSEGADHDAV